VAQSKPKTYSYTDNVDKAARIFAENECFIRAIIRYKVRDDSQAEDMFQDFFLSLVCKPVPQDIENVKSYLYRAISNDIVDAARRMKRYKNHVHKYGEQSNYSINKTGPGDALLSKEKSGKILGLAKRRLTTNEYKAISLRYEKDHNIKEVAEKMGVNKRTISRYISVGLKKVREFLIDERVNLK